MSFEEAEMHAKLKESVSDPKCVDRTDKILKALAQLQEKTTPNQSLLSPLLIIIICLLIQKLCL